MNWREEARAFVRFVRAPRRLRGHNPEGAPWLPRLLGLSALTIVLGVLVDTAATPLGVWAGAKSALPDQITPGLLLGALVFAPIVEELLFRGGLRRVDYTLGLGPLLVAAMLMPWNRWTLAALAAAALAMLAIHTLLARRARHRPGLRFRCGRRFVRHYAWVFWLYTLAFALAHVGNYEWSNPRTALVTPALVLPQLVIGTSLGYIRLRDGLRSSMLMHLLVNATATLLIALGI